MDSGDPESNAPITFEDLGLKTEAATVETFVGTRRPLSSLSNLEWSFIVVALISTLSALGLTIERVISVDKSTPNATFAVLLLINIAFIIFYIFNGVFGERAFEVLAFAIGTFILLLYCVINYATTVDATKDKTEKNIKLARLVLICVFGPVDIIMGLIIAKQYYESKNLIFRTVGANVLLQELCNKVFLCESLLKFDLQLTMSLVFLIMNNGLQKPDLEEKLVLALGVSYGIFWAVLGFLALRYENKPMTWVVFATSWMQPAYIIFKICDLGLNWTASQEQRMISGAIIMCSFFGLVLRTVVVGGIILVYRNYGKGLKEKVLGNPSNEETTKVVHSATT